MVITELGWCRTINFCEQKSFLQADVEENRLFPSIEAEYDPYVPENYTPPFMTTLASQGMNVRIFRENEEMAPSLRNANTYLLMIHSPFEVPTRTNRRFQMVDMDYNSFYITPQLNKIDETMIGMEPKE